MEKGTEVIFMISMVNVPSRIDEDGRKEEPIVAPK